MTVGGNAPVNNAMHLSSQEVQWVSKVKYLGFYLTNGTYFEIDFDCCQEKI